MPGHDSSGDTCTGHVRTNGDDDDSHGNCSYKPALHACRCRSVGCAVYRRHRRTRAGKRSHRYRHRARAGRHHDPACPGGKRSPAAGFPEGLRAGRNASSPHLHAAAIRAHGGPRQGLCCGRARLRRGKAAELEAEGVQILLHPVASDRPRRHRRRDDARFGAPAAEAHRGGHPLHRAGRHAGRIHEHRGRPRHSGLPARICRGFREDRSRTKIQSARYYRSRHRNLSKQAAGRAIRRVHVLAGGRLGLSARQLRHGAKGAEGAGAEIVNPALPLRRRPPPGTSEKGPTVTMEFPSAGLRRRALLSTLVLVSALPGMVRSSAAVAQTAISGDPLSSWNEGPAKAAILKFVHATTDRTSPDYVPPEARIATFDQDGTLWVEQPAYAQVMYCLDRVPDVVKAKPELATVEPFRTVLSGDREAIGKLTMPDLEKIAVATLTGMSTDEFTIQVKQWLGTAKHPRWHRPYTELTFFPMQEVLQYLRANGFHTYIVTGGGQDFVRVYAEAVYGIPPEQVVGTVGGTSFGHDSAGKPILTKEPKLLLNDDHAG